MSTRAEWLKQQIKEEGDLRFEVINGFVCEVVRHPTLLHLSGYINVPKKHPWFGKEYDSVNVDVHGGLTYSDTGAAKGLWRLGFDTAHYGDIAPSILFTSSYTDQQGTYKDMSYVLNELDSLSLQAKKLMPGYKVKNSEAIIAKISLYYNTLISSVSS
jgi:hypothetical protein